MSDDPNPTDEQSAAEQPPEDAVIAVQPVPEGMMRVHVVLSFTVRFDDGRLVRYTTEGTNCGEPGYWDVPADDANHWYIMAHTDDPPPAPGEPAVGTVEWENSTRARRQSARLAIMAREQESEFAGHGIRDAHEMPEDAASEEEVIPGSRVGAPNLDVGGGVDLHQAAASVEQAPRTPRRRRPTGG